MHFQAHYLKVLPVRLRPAFGSTSQLLNKLSQLAPSVHATICLKLLFTAEVNFLQGYPEGHTDTAAGCLQSLGLKPVAVRQNLNLSGGGSTGTQRAQADVADQYGHCGHPSNLCQWQEARAQCFHLSGMSLGLEWTNAEFWCLGNQSMHSVSALINICCLGASVGSCLTCP